MGPLPNGPKYNAETLKIQIIYKRKIDYTIYVVMIPVLKLGPFSNQWAQIDVLSLNGWAQCINAWAHCQMGPNTMQEPRRCRHRRLRAWAQNKNVDFGSETVNYEVTNNTWAQLPKTNQKLVPSLGPNFQ